MKRLIPLFVVLAIAGAPVAAQTHYISPDVPTDDPGPSGAIFLPWEVIEYTAGAYVLPPTLTLPQYTTVDALHKMDKPNHWLFSVEAPTTLGATTYQPDDVILFDGSVYSLYVNSPAGLPPGVNVDALFLDTDDFGDLIISFDVPVTIGAMTYYPGDLVRYSGGAYSLFSTAGSGIASSSNVTGADATAMVDILSLDIPTDPVPSVGWVTYETGDIATWNGLNYSLYLWSLAGWPESSEVDAFSCQANPGRVYDRNVYQLPITLDKSLITTGNIVISWAPSCSSGAEDYGIYEGNIGSWPSHTWKICGDIDGSPFSEDFLPNSNSSYYLVVPYNFTEEGAYGLDFDPTRVPPRIERAVGIATCRPTQILTACP